jgi:molybdopterin-biosynthesis enzyme MoeA-like protein
VRGIPESGLAPILDEVRKKNPLAYFKSHPKRHEGKPLIEIHVSNTSESKEAAEKIVRDGMKDLIEALKSCGAEIVWGL